MKIIVVGGTGLIGSAVVAELKDRHEIIIAGHKQGGDVQVDVADPQSIRAMYTAIGSFDAVVSATGQVAFAEFSQLTEAQYRFSIDQKLMGQVNLVTLGMAHINDHGSFTLTSGILSCDPIRTGVAASMVNSAVDGFVRGAAIEMARGIRINSVSPTVVTEAMELYGAYFRGFESVPVNRVALAYSKSVEGLQTGQVYRVN